MSKGYKYTVGALFAGAVLMFILFFVIGGKKEYIITFDSNGGSSISNQTVVEGNSVTKPANPTKENYNFVRWEYQNREYNFDNKVSSDITLKAIWEESKELKYYDVEFTVNGKTEKLSLSQITLEDLMKLGFEEKDGYEIKWYINGEEYDFTKPLELTENIKIEGKYVKTTLFTVKFNSNGGTAVNSQKVKANEKIKEPDVVTRHGYIFEGWYLDKNKFDFNTPITKNITLVAKWSEDSSVKRYIVTFDSDGGSNVEKQRVVENEAAKAPKNPTKKGFKFLGWYLDDKKYDFKASVKSDITLKAKWEEIIQYTVTFNKDNGSTNDTVKVNAGEKVTKPKNPTKKDYIFIEWQYEDKTFNFNTPITSDITLVAHYREAIKYTVTFDSNGGSNVSSQTVSEGNKATVPTKPTKANHDFVEWQLNGTKYDFNKVVTSDITLVAKWKEQNYTYKMIATRKDNYSPDSVLKLYRDNNMNNEIEFKSIVIGGKTIDPHPSINTNYIRNKLQGSSIKVILNDNSEVTASIEFR